MPWFLAYGGFAAGFHRCCSNIDPSSILNTSTFNGRQHLSISCSLSLPNPHNERSPPGHVPADISFACFEGMSPTQGHQQVLLSQELNMITCLCGTRIHEISPFVVETSHLEKIDHVMDIRLIQAERDNSTSQIGMTVIVIRGLSAGQHGVDVWITACPQQIMNSPTMLINAVPR